MQAVILAAGRGKRMGKLTDALPKPMLSVGGKNLLEYKMDALPSEIDEVVMVVGYLAEKIIEYFGDVYEGKKILYVHVDPEKELLGTGYALWKAKDVLHDRFLVMMGDDIYNKEDIQKCIQSEWSILVHKVSEMKSGGKVVLDGNGNLKDIVEGEHTGPGLINTGLYVLKQRIFNYPLVKLPGREEWGLPQTLLQVVGDVSVRVVHTASWMQISDPADLLNAELSFEKSMN